MTRYEGEWREGIKDGLGWMVMPFAESTGKRIVLGRKAEFIFRHVQREALATPVEMTNGTVVGEICLGFWEVLTVDLHV